MKILFINLKDTVGGAVIAMTRLATELEKDGKIQMYFLVGRKKSNKPNVFPTRNRIQRIVEERIIEPLTSLLGLQYQWFPFSSRTILKQSKAINPDIINLHLTHGAYFQTSLLKKLSKIAPIVWTLHDMWSFTGNAAHTFGDESWKSLNNTAHLTRIYPAIGINTGAWLLRQKKKIYRESNLTIVSPSKWLANLANQSPLFEGKKNIQINNGVDVDTFQPYNKTEVRNAFNIPTEAKVLMFSAAYLKGDIWKGGEHLMEILRRINDSVKDKIHLLMIGSGKNEELSSYRNFVIYETGYVDDEHTMARYLSATDLFIYPTKADNLPNVLIEAIACGTPCVTFDIGGCAEIITNDFNGLVVKPFDFDSMAGGILSILGNQAELARMSKNARECAIKNFSVRQMATLYTKLFTETKKIES